MSSFYEKLSMKFQETGVPEEGEKKPASPGAVTYRATGDRTTPASPAATAAAPDPGTEKAPEGTDPMDVDLFQSESRMVIFMQASGIPASGFSLTLSEESNTLVVEATQKRPELPTMGDKKEGAAPEKGIYAKTEIKWKSLYRKIYLPASFDASGATAVLGDGVLVVTLPAKHPGAGKTLTVQEARQDEHKK
jgi:HSP20 family molecular chaperone IbpA